MLQASRSTVWRSNPALRLVVTQSIAGAILGLAFAAGLFVFDAHGLGTLMRGSDIGIVAFVLMAGGFMVTFGSLVAGGAIMLQAGRNDDDDQGGGRRFMPGLVPAMVPARIRRPHQRRR